MKEFADENAEEGKESNSSEERGLRMITVNLLSHPLPGSATSSRVWAQQRSMLLLNTPITYSFSFKHFLINSSRKKFLSA